MDAAASGAVAPASTRRRWLSATQSEFWPFAAIAVALLAHLHMALTRAINWDEFYHYSQVQKLVQGTLNEPLQTLYTRAFAWVADLPGSGIDHIIVIRLFMLMCELVVTAAIIGAASRFVARPVAALSGLAYLTAGYVLQHGTSFRFDAPAAALLMTAAWMLLQRRLTLPTVAIAGVLAGTSAVLTIKTILYAPVFLGIAWLLWREAAEKRAAALRLFAVGAAALLSFVAIYMLHASSLGPDSSNEASKLVSSAGDKMFALMSYWSHTLRGAQIAIVQTLLILLFPGLLWISVRPRAEKVAIAGFYLPILTLLFYHNTAPYFHVYMLPPVMVACSVSLEWVAKRYSVAAVAALLGFSGGVVLAKEPPNTIERQREILGVADRLFPDGVAYFDSCAMLGRFPKANVFMTPWGITRYQSGDYPTMESVMAAKPVPLVVNDDYMFEKALAGTGPVPEFLPGDLAAIRDTYIPLWGPLWIAGEIVPAGAADRAIRIRVAGPYTVRDAPIIVDGKHLGVGDVVDLARGEHSVSADVTARLTWGRDLKLPPQPDKGGPIFMPF